MRFRRAVIYNGVMRGKPTEKLKPGTPIVIRAQAKGLSLNCTRLCRSSGATPRTALACLSFSSTLCMWVYNLYFKC